jgi:hypothetical protein
LRTRSDRRHDHDQQQAELPHVTHAQCRPELGRVAIGDTFRPEPGRSYPFDVTLTLAALACLTAYQRIDAPRGVKIFHAAYAPRRPTEANQLSNMFILCYLQARFVAYPLQRRPSDARTLTNVRPGSGAR